MNINENVEIQAWITPYTIAASGTVLVYDYLLTLDQEISLVWAAPRLNIGTVLFFVNRYLPFIDTFLSLRLLTAPVTPTQCLHGYTVVTWLITIGTISAEMILMLRTYALWSGKRSIAITLIIMALLCYPPCLVVVWIEIASLDYVKSPLGINGCTFGKSPSNIIFIVYVILVISETTIVVLTFVRAFYHLRRTTVSWIYKLYSDGVVFYLYLLAISVANVIVPVAGPRVLANWLATPQHILHSLLCTRVMLFIFSRRTASPGSARSTLGADSSTLAQIFTSFIGPVRTAAEWEGQQEFAGEPHLAGVEEIPLGDRASELR